MTNLCNKTRGSPDTSCGLHKWYLLSDPKWDFCVLGAEARPRLKQDVALGLSLERETVPPVESLFML